MVEILNMLDIIPTEKLLQHEQVIEKNLLALRESMLNMGRLVDPIIVEKKHYVVLDGNHRKTVLDTIKCPNAACQLVDYEDEGIKIGGWFPAVKNIDLGVFEHKKEKVDFEAGIEALDKMKGSFMAVKRQNNSRECLLFNSFSGSLRDIVEEQNALVSKIPPSNIAYVEDYRAEEFLADGRTVLYRRMFTKEDVVKEALAHRPLPPKSTRHSIPNRIIRLNLHLGWLSDTRENAKGLMEDMLHKRMSESTVRRYTEPVIVIY
ncbi:hypothetical protein J4441_04870 [Candidatus Micrarchaeota archaeon]|nr:hypothetical protein [Candidatus Micrarchaeota archaeon]